ncbi:cadherin EGF LAG seven-pass G-type receptor 3 isoform X1 [Epinephelus fuscoguttatus]|uniref:cadherin EGF LAG seven-pass G-type receptor 3 isoform X1 n=1 Tax=Epinephelus fuscoguttatus TaxID=293821 RepID=UPI0020D15E53|nr:cadherin EGF LAG seven-pass G-type receptor 3 isoform X1 [Epinephelus fuscoguttatus]
MAAPLTGFTPLLLSSLALHLLLLGPLFALTPGTVNTGGAFNRWTPGLCYRDAGKVSQQQQQQQREEAGESPRGSWNLRPSRWTGERIQTEGCSGVQRAGGTPGRYHQDGTRKERQKGVGTFSRSANSPPAPSSPPPPPPHHPGIRSRSSTDGVGAGEGVDRGWMRRKGVVSPPASPAFTSSPVQNGKKRAVQRTRACAQRWPASRPHLAKRGAARAFVRASGLCGAPGSGGRRGVEVWERAREVRRLSATWCSLTPGHLCWSSPDKQALSPASSPSLGPLPTGCSCCIHPQSGYKSPHSEASDTSRFHPRFNNNSDCTQGSKLDYIYHFPACDSPQTGHTDKIQLHPVYRSRNNNRTRDADGDSASVDRRAGNCSHLGRHNVIDPSSIREGGDDGCLTGCIRCEERERGARSGGDEEEEEGEEAFRCSTPAVLNPSTWAHLDGCRRIVDKRERDERREGNDGRGGGGGVNQGNKHINLSNYPDNGLAFPILTLLCKAYNELPQGKSAPATGGQSSQTRGESREVPGACFGCLDGIEMGDGYLAEFMVPEGVIAQRNLPIQFSPGSITETPGQRFPSSKSAIPKFASKYLGPALHTPPQTHTGDYTESGELSKPLRLCAEKVTSDSESACDSGFFSPAKFPVKSPGVVSAASRSATTLAPRLLSQPDDTTAKHLSFSPVINLTAWQDESARPLHLLPVKDVISARRTAPTDPQRVFLWSRFNSNSNNNNEEEGRKETYGHSHESGVEKSPWHGQTVQQGDWETALGEMVKAGCAQSVSTDCSATEQGDRTHMQLKSGKQVPLEPEGVRQSDRRQMGAEGEKERDAEREGEGLEGSAAAAVGRGKLQVGEGEREARLMGGREPGGEEQEEEEWEREMGITKASQAEESEAEGGKGQDRGSSTTTITQPDSEREKKESQADESHEVGEEEEMEVEGEEERHSSRGERSLERLIIVADDEISQGERGRKILMPWSRSRRAANRHPHFSQYNFQVQVAENQPPGTSVIIMSASDPDAGDAGRVSYSMAPLMNSRSSDYFHIHPDTGLITTTQILDREHMDLHYFRVTATDFGASRLSGTTMVAITVSDRNDHSPVFEQTEYRETIRENVEEGYPILQLRATDLDSPSNANIRYRFVGDTAAIARAAFEIDPRSGLITTRGAVDRETNEHYTLQVEASDQGKEPGPRSANVKVFITVLDENDNVPQFSEKRYVVAVKEDVRPHSEILRVSASDLDKDSNAAVHYNIISGNSRGQFSIDSVTGEIHVVAPLDFESEREYTLRVRAQDNGRPPLSNNTGIVSVQVTDVNDNPPIFVSTPFQASVLESAPVGSSILHIQAIDTDSGDNARLEYRLTGTSSDTPFIINSATGWVTVSSILDRESVEHYFFGVEARDYGMPPLSATASVTITVMDVNDNRPEFLQKEYYARLNEDAVVGTSVVTVTAVDRDVNSAVTYQITGGNTRNRFAISTAGGAGLLTLALPLDYKQERRYVLTVTASDRTLHDTCQVHINITDANTHRPVFQSAHYSVSVNEDRPPGSTVVVISATDDDVGENARITYFLEDNIPQFRIDSATGAITLQAELDYEDQMTYTLAITAKDNGIPQKSDTTYVEVNVNDVNDNAPQFLSPRYQGTVSEDAPPFTSVLQISATDRDAHANGRVQYTFQKGEDGDGDFTIEPTSGIVRSVRRLDRESVPFYELTAYAVDRGVPPQRTPVHIQVTVLDVNDNAPVFPADDFEVLVKENSAVGSVVAQITAIDPDEGANAQIMYQIVEGNIPEIFQMDIFSGELTSLIDLDYETRNEYVIVVQATSAPLVSRATVRIRLVDQNDNRPTLQDFQIIFNNFVSNRSNSFPSGVIGRVPAHDPDVSDRLYYTIDRGNELHLLLLNHTSGEIRLSRKLDNNRPLVAAMLITVTDGAHSISAQCVLRVLIITEDMLGSSVTVRLQNMSQEHFLSPLLSNFLEGVSAVLSVPVEDVFIFNIQPDLDAAPGGILNVSFSAALPGGLFFPSETLEEQLYLNRPRLTSLTQMEVLPFDDNVCLREPCQNYMKCISVLRFNSSAPFISSPSILFRPIHPIAGLRCRCPVGFTGDYCETEINLCYSNPCMNGGVCARREGGYTCICREDYTGDRCEFDRRQGRCVPGVCRNGGTCRELSGGGFRCECPAGGYERPYCTVTARSFPPKSFAMFRGLRQRFHLSISLTFATLENSGLLFYNGRFNEKHDFIALEIQGGQVVLKYSTGESSTQVSPFLPGGVSDGNWHTVHIHYYNKPATRYPKRSMSGEAQGPSDEKIAVVSVDDCDTALSLRFGTQLGNYSCAAQGKQTSNKKSLDLTGPLFLGGVPNVPDNFPFGTREFIGCMKELHIDNKPLDLAGFIANNGTLPGCSAKLPFCKSNPCQNGGTCRVSWETFSCDCPLGYGGKDCSHVMPHPHRFLGNSALWWDLKNDVTISTPWYLGLVFRTRAREGTLLQAQAGQYTSLLFQVINGQLVFSVTRGSTRPVRLRLDQVQVADGRWHDLQLELRDVRSGRETRYVATLRLDFGLYQGTVIVGNEIHGLKVKHLHVGGVLGSGEVQNGIKGCIQGVRLGVRPDSPALPRPSRAVKVETGCNVGNPCVSSPCPGHSRCSDQWERHTCICEPGYYGRGCTDACHLNPCENEAQCHRKPSSSHGYICDCGDNHYGQYCQHRIDHQCPRGWWGSPTCGPCHCDTNKGFDPDCNKTSGYCHCKEFHYRLRSSDTCLPCDCYPVGSFSRSCDPETGQCQCRAGVIGRQCNICDSPFAEVTNSGCEVIYDGCPKTITQGIWWPRTKFNLPAAVPCPKGSVGAAIRHCDVERGWLEPDLYNCTSPPFVELNAALDSLERNETELNTIMEKKLAHQLRDVTEATTRLYGNDLQIAERLLSRLLTFETQQSGFGLTATQDAHFNENIVRGCSVLLGPGTSGLWRALAQSQNHIPGGGPAELTELLEQYAQNLAQNMKLTYLNPVALVAPNIVMNLDRVENQTHVRRRFPRYHNTLFRGQALWDPYTHVILPPAALVPQRQQQQHNWKEKERAEKEPSSPQNAASPPVGIASNQTGEYTAARRTVSMPEQPITIVILLIYRSLGSALPPKYHTDRRGVRLPRHPVMNSPVVSISVYNNQTFVGGHLDQPILLEFKLLETSNRSKPLCVQWNHSTQYETGGCWTVRDCIVVYRNTSHVRCQCQRLGTFGVLMDSSQREQLEGDLETLALVTYSSLCVSMLALLLTVLVLSCLRGLKSNTRSIHSNTAAAMFLSELVFLLGVNQTEQQFLCTVVAILLHYFFMSTFAWMFVEGLHIYRMQTEQRNINFGAMRFYYAIGWGVPAIITGLAVGLDPEGYGNPDFCWISIYDKLIWSFAGPIAIVILMNGGIFMIVAKMSCNPSQKETKKLPVIATIRNAFLLLLVATSTWLCGLMAVNNSILAFYYIFNVLCLVQGLSVMLVFTVFNSEVKEAWSVACLGKKSPGEDPPRPPQNTAQNPYHNASLLEQSGLHRITLGTSTISSVSSARENLLARQTLEQNIVHTGATDLDVAMFHRDGGEDSDSDSDLSMEEERSLSIPSSESEDNVRLRGRIQRRFKRSNHSERLLTEPTHNGTKDLDGNDLLSYWPALEECETHSLQKWGSERPLGADYSKDAANNNQPDAALTSGDENGLTQPHRHRKGILKNRLGCPPALQGLSTMGRVPSELNWYRTSTLGHRGVPAASYGRMYSATAGAGGGSGSLSQPASRYSSREHLDSLSRRQLSRDPLGRQTVGGSRDRLDSRGSRDNLDLLPRRRELGLGQGAGLGGLGLDHQRVSSSRENLTGSRDRLDNHHTGSVHASREDLSGNGGAVGAGVEGYLSGSRSQLNSLTRRQASSREHLGGAMMSSRSREQLETNGGGAQAQPCREWLRTLPPRQPSHPDQPPSSSPPPPISEEPQQEQHPAHVRGRLDSAPPCRYPGQTVPQGAGLNPNPLGRQPSSEHLDILSSILASFNSSVLTPPPAASNPGPNGSAHGPSPSPPQSATSHSISEVSPDSEANRSEGQS